MSKKKDFNQGVAAGIKVAQKVLNHEIEAMDYLRSKIDLIVEGHDDMATAVTRLIEDKDEAAIKDIFGVVNQDKPSDLKDHEKQLLLNILATLSVAGQNDRQKKYLINLRHHLGLQGVEPEYNYDFRRIGSLESVRSIKTIAKAIRVYLYLQDCNMDGIYYHEEDLFSHFNMNLRSFDEIDATIEMIVCLFGEDGLVELYGDYEEYEHKEQNQGKPISISLRTARVIFENYLGFHRVLTDNQIIIEDDNKWIIVDKDTAEIKEFETKDNTSRLEYCAVIGCDLFFFEKNILCKLNTDKIEKNQIAEFPYEFITDDDTKEIIIPELSVFANNSLRFGYSYRNDNGWVDTEEWMYSLEKKAFLRFDEIFNNFKQSSRGCFYEGKYYIVTEQTDDSKKSKNESWWFRLAEYSLDKDEMLNISDSFGEHKEKAYDTFKMTDIIADVVLTSTWSADVVDIVDNVACVQVKHFSWNLLKSMVKKADTSMEEVWIYNFNLVTGKLIKTINLGEIGNYKFYSHFMVYVDRKKYDLNVLDLLTGEIKNIAKEYKYVEKNGLLRTPQAEYYALMDNWIYFKTKSASGRELVSIESIMN